MPILQVTKQELVEAKLEYILVDPQKFAYELVSENYFWHTDQPEATLCMLAGIGKVLIDKTKD
jgi:hypothetical protein